MSNKSKDMLRRLEDRLDDINRAVQAVVVRAGVQSADTLVVRDIVSRLATDIDSERRASDELDLRAPGPSVSDQSTRSAETSSQYRAGFIEKAKIPVFSGRLEDYPDFKDQFRDLTQNCGHPPSALLQQLRDKVPSEAKTELVGAKSLEEAWESLDERYGDVDMTTKMIKERLNNLKLDPFQPQNEHVIVVANAVKHAMKLLSAEQQNDALANDKELVGNLVGKLSQGLRDSWHDFATDLARGPRPNTWSMFKSWLNERKRKAVYARKENMLSGKKNARVVVPGRAPIQC